ncbi:basic helix-loop-helix protein A-like protein [Cinnamomum micranthum f. kanehirae]|uniref:Basic helix-loop-helix protein A-like protein n=1 Tax=Cinnamomum micranthum f. kanehirae TaxID=337451 RepID=A0A443PX70_9MAGN|nr:basic helix-loop-helix protein A-like protein [Cinnamomum micranthum f. kanehirae]
MACPGSSRLQQMLQAAVQGVQWTYSLFWQLCPQQGILVWGDGYYNGAIKTRKTVQPMEVSAEEASLQRSQQLRELYESLSAGETGQPARRPCAALSPEDLTESEWFYLMCVSFSFPPGVGLPGKAYAKRQHVWLTGANEADSKVFSRAILAKSARIQTVLCIPLMDGVLELGTTDRVQEDSGLIQHAKNYFMDHYNQHHFPKPALSEHSTSNPMSSSERPHYHSPPVPAMFAPIAPRIKEAEANQEVDDDDDDDEEEDEEEEEPELDSEAETGRESPVNVAQNPLQLHGQVTDGTVMGQAAAEPSELMQLEMSEDIRFGSPDDGSNNLDSELQVLAGVGPVDHYQHAESYRAESARPWPMLQYELSSDLPHSGGPQIPELTQEDAHYSHTVSVILQLNASRWTVSSSASSYLRYSQQSAFSNWNCRSDYDPLLRPPALDGTSQWMIKYILFTLPSLHTKYKDEDSPKSREGGDAGTRFRKGTPQDELSANHVLAERRRREKLNERFIILRSLVPFVTKMDKASILGDTIEYVKQLRRKIQDLESRNREFEIDQRAKGTELHKSSNSKEVVQQSSGSAKANASQSLSTDRSRLPVMEKRKMRIIEGTGSVKTKGVEATFSNTVEVSIIESDALLELKCPYRDGLLLEIMQILCELRLEITAVQSSSTNGALDAEIRAKVKVRINGKKASIVEVKKAINQIISQ